MACPLMLSMTLSKTRERSTMRWGAWPEMLPHEKSSCLLRVGLLWIAHCSQAESLPLLCLQSCVDQCSASLSSHLASCPGWFR